VSIEIITKLILEVYHKGKLIVEELRIRIKLMCHNFDHIQSLIIGTTSTLTISFLKRV